MTCRIIFFCLKDKEFLALLLKSLQRCAESNVTGVVWCFCILVAMIRSLAVQKALMMLLASMAGEPASKHISKPSSSTHVLALTTFHCKKKRAWEMAPIGSLVKGGVVVCALKSCTSSIGVRQSLGKVCLLVARAKNHHSLAYLRMGAEMILNIGSSAGSWESHNTLMSQPIDKKLPASAPATLNL